MHGHIPTEPSDRLNMHGLSLQHVLCTDADSNLSRHSNAGPCKGWWHLASLCGSFVSQESSRSLTQCVGCSLGVKAENALRTHGEDRQSS